MQYLLAIYEDEAAYPGGFESQAFQQILQAHMALVEQMQQAGVMRGGAGLMPSNTATTLRTRAGAVSIHDGPYIETKEQLGGFYLLELESLDQAIAWAKRIPLGADGSIEIRPALAE